MRIKGFVTLCAATACLAALALPAEADVIDFESGFVDRQSVGQVKTATNVVTFSVGSGLTPPNTTSNAFIAEAGGKNASAFFNLTNPHDNTANSSQSGQFFLTDESNLPQAGLNYFLLFESPVLDLSLDLYDYRMDGGPSAGSQATLTVYSDEFLTAIAEDFFAIPDENPEDGNIETLEVVVDAASPIFAAAITFSTPDLGTAIDNIMFNMNTQLVALQQTVPEPATVLLMGLGLVGLGVARRRRQFDPAFCV